MSSENSQDNKGSHGTRLAGSCAMPAPAVVSKKDRAAHGVRDGSSKSSLARAFQTFTLAAEGKILNLPNLISFLQ